MSMNLGTYIKQFPRAERSQVRAAIGAACGRSEMAVRHWANGNRKPPAELADKIVRATKGKVTRRELRPDIFGSAQ